MTNQNKRPCQPPTLVRLGKDEPAGIRTQSYMWTCPIEQLELALGRMERLKLRRDISAEEAQQLSDLRFTLYHRRKDKSA